MTNLALICARGGSKGVPKKNIRNIAGKPLIAHTILQAQESAIFDMICVSSDCDDILEVSKEYGAYIIKRPDTLATDESSVIPALHHAVKCCEKETGHHFDKIFLLQPTSPLRTISDIHKCAQKFDEGGKDNIFSVCEATSSPYYNLVEYSENNEIMLCKEANFVRRQDVPQTYELNGAIYGWKRDAFFSSCKVITPQSDIYIMSEENSVDIDNPLDFKIADFLLNDRIKQGIKHD